MLNVFRPSFLVKCIIELLVAVGSKLDRITKPIRAWVYNAPHWFYVAIIIIMYIVVLLD